MSSRYEMIGAIVSHIERSALVLALYRRDSMGLSELVQSANAKLATLAKDPLRPKAFQEHLKALERVHLVTHNSKTYKLTDMGSKIVEELVHM
jgi:predicted transcriptional regulator